MPGFANARVCETWSCLRGAAVLAAIVLAAGGSACGGGSPTKPTSGSSVVHVTVTGPTTMNVGDTTQFTATAQLFDGTQQTCSPVAAWESSNTSVASIAAGGMVTARAAGNAEIKATYGGVSGSKSVSVNAPSSCTYGLTSDKTVYIGKSGGSGTATFVSTGGGTCSWTASADQSWITVQDTSGSGNISVRYTVAANTTGVDRQGLIQVRWPGPQAGENIQIVQSR